MDALGSAIRVDARGRRGDARAAARQRGHQRGVDLPTRPATPCDGLMRQRLDRPYVRDRPASCGRRAGARRFAAVAGQAEGDRARPHRRDRRRPAGRRVDEGGAGPVHAAWACKTIDCRQDGMALGAGPARELAVQLDHRRASRTPTRSCWSAPTRASRRRCSTPASASAGWRARLRVGVVGEAADLTYPLRLPGRRAADPGAGSPSRRATSSRRCKAAKTPAVIVGAGRAGAARTAPRCCSWRPRWPRSSEGWNGFNVLHTAASRVGGLDMGFVPGEGGKTAPRAGGQGRRWTCCSCWAPTRSTPSGLATPSSSIWARHGDAGAHRADVILPGAAYTEKPGLYVNTEGRVQMADRAVFPKGEAKEDWAILRALSDAAGRASCPTTAWTSCAPS